jgi:peptidoglycan hydrolase-like protein with peptidoglycan-binding domain
MPASKVVLVQRALNDFGYGPVKSSGNVGPDTNAAIQKFERERKLPVTGQISPRFLRELATVTGRTLD